jgi:hypothetical protein
MQLQPSMLPKPGNSTAQGLGSELASQRFALEFGACPVGTIPIRDTTLSSTTTAAAAAAASTAHETTTPSPPRSYTRAAADKKAASTQMPLTAHVLDDDYTHEVSCNCKRISKDHRLTPLNHLASIFFH